ncbi:MAG TPA: hypothetical protein VLT62_24965 [Candidatus Methylomirabilis sp.]|nr:hypothetical protein [Candidatus Methylomirabilis sp.]
MRRLLPVLPVALVCVLLVAVEVSADPHRSRGLLVRVDPAERAVVLVENGHHLKLIVGRDAVFLDDRGQRLHSLEGLHVGDYVREECRHHAAGPPIASQISVLVPAWRRFESPEY